MLKIRIKGTTKEIKWFLKMIQRDKRFFVSEPSGPFDMERSEKYKRSYVEIFRNENEFNEYRKNRLSEHAARYYGSGTVFLDSVPDEMRSDCKRKVGKRYV